MTKSDSLSVLTGPSHAAALDPGISRARMLALRAIYAFIVAGQLGFVWPALLAQLPTPAHYHGIVMIMLAAFSLLCALGMRYPIQMLPILLWEVLWKLMWLLLVALPSWQAGTMRPATVQTMIDCFPLVLVLAAIPWGYVARNYATKPAERAVPQPVATAQPG